VQEKHYYADDQQDMNSSGGNMKGKESQQPKDNQNRRDYSQHFQLLLTLNNSTIKRRMAGLPKSCAS
jgi:hypothetical protein